MNEDIKQAVRNATGAAMENGKAFSWIKTHEVQAGVYLSYTQELFAKYKMQ